MLALDALASSRKVEIAVLVTVLLEDGECVRMHGTPRSLVEAQAEALGIPLTLVRVPSRASNDTYEHRMAEALHPLCERGVDTVAAADLFLEDIRRYRERMYRELGMKIIFPIWGRDTQTMATDFLDRGFRALVTSVDTTQLDPSFAGRPYDRGFLADVPAEVDPCGENGEFHTFVTGGPLMKREVPVQATSGKKDGRMCFARLEPAA